MMKNSLGKASVYIAAFAFGYAAGHFNHTQPATADLSPIVYKALDSACPTINSQLTQATPTPELNIHSDEKPIANAAEGPPPKTDTDIELTDYENPDEQIQAVLTAEQNSFSAESEQLVENVDLLEAMYQLAPEHQLDFVKRLVNSQEDSAIVALNDLILHDNSAIQNAAIESMLNLLEMRTGHYEMIAQNLEQNSVFLSEEQLDKLQEITRLAAANP